MFRVTNMKAMDRINLLSELLGRSSKETVLCVPYNITWVPVALLPPTLVGALGVQLEQTTFRENLKDATEDFVVTKVFHKFLRQVSTLSFGVSFYLFLQTVLVKQISKLIF